MSDLAAMGVSIQRRSLSGDGKDTAADGAELTEIALTLPKSSDIQATFSQEGLGTKLLKIFKKEIQTGDALFDEAVHVNTETMEATEAVLQSTELRAIIERIVANGGAIEIDGASVKMQITSGQSVDDDVLAEFAAPLLAPRG
jgi:hypothetical protein